MYVRASIVNTTQSAWGWAREHPVGAASCVVAAPAAIATVPLALGAVGFTAGGFAAGKHVAKTRSEDRSADP